MTLSLFFNAMCRRLTPRSPLLLYASTWTAILTVTVAVASFSPEVAFVSSITPTSAFSRSCEGEGFVRIPLDVPTEILCFSAQMFRKSKLDLLVPPVFAAIVVIASAYVVRSLGLWEVDHDLIR